LIPTRKKGMYVASICAINRLMFGLGSMWLFVLCQVQSNVC
jgi:hypothetical protein